MGRVELLGVGGPRTAGSSSAMLLLGAWLANRVRAGIGHIVTERAVRAGLEGVLGVTRVGRNALLGVGGPHTVGSSSAMLLGAWLAIRVRAGIGHVVVEGAVRAGLKGVLGVTE